MGELQDLAAGANFPVKWLWNERKINPQQASLTPGKGARGGARPAVIRPPVHAQTRRHYGRSA